MLSRPWRRPPPGEAPASSKWRTFAVAVAACIAAIFQIQWLTSNKHVNAGAAVIQVAAALFGVMAVPGGRRLLRRLFIAMLVFVVAPLASALSPILFNRLFGNPPSAPVYVSGDKPAYDGGCWGDAPVLRCSDSDGWRLAAPGARIDSQLRLDTDRTARDFSIFDVTTDGCDGVKVDWTAWAGSAEVGHGTLIGRATQSSAIRLPSSPVVHLRISAGREDTKRCAAFFEISREYAI